MEVVNERHYRAMMILFLFSLVTLFPVLLSFRDLWDGTIVSYAFESSNPEIFKTWFDESGWPLVTFIYSVAYYISSFLDIHIKILINIVVFASIYGASYELYKISRYVFNMSKVSALVASILFLSTPAWSILVSSVFLMHALFIYMCLLGVRLFLLTNTLKIKFAGVVSILISFQHAANPAIAIPILLYDYVVNKNMKGTVVLVVVSIVYFFAFRWLFPAHNLYQDYNKILIEKLFDWSLYQLAFEYFKLIYFPVLPVFFLTVICLIRSKFFNREVLFFVLFVIMSIAPYMAVGKVPGSSWNHRFAFNAAIPLSLLVAYLTGLVVHYKFIFKLVVCPLILSLIVVLIVNLYKGYDTMAKSFLHQAYFIKAFKKQPKPKPGVIIFKNWRGIPAFYSTNYYLYLAYNTASWHTSLKSLELANFQPYKDKYAMTNFFNRCLYHANVSENLASASSIDRFKFFLREDRFMEDNEKLYFNVDLAEVNCASDSSQIPK